MSEQRERIARLWDQADALAYGPARTTLLEEAVRLADLDGDTTLAFAARQRLIDTAEFSGRPDAALVAFTWCLAAADDDPRLLDHALLWQYKWIVSHLPELPRVTRAQIDGAIEDMARRFAQAGAGAQAVAKARWRSAEAMGDLAAADDWRERWRHTGRDELSDCRACDVSADVESALTRGRIDEGMALAEPILDGRLSCAEVPHQTLADVLLPALRAGRLEDARFWHLRGYRMIAANPNFMSSIAQHVAFLALTGNHAKGLTLAERHLRWAFEREEGLARLRFLGAACLLFERAGDLATGAMRLPPALVGDAQPDGRDPAALAAIFARAAEDLAAAFDARNGNAHWSSWLADLRALPGLAWQLPLTRPLITQPGTDGDRAGTAPGTGGDAGGEGPGPGATGDAGGEGAGLGAGGEAADALAAGALGPRAAGDGTPGAGRYRWVPPARVLPAGDDGAAWFAAGDAREDALDEAGAVEAFETAGARHLAAGEAVKAAECDRRRARLLATMNRGDEAEALLRAIEPVLEAGGDLVAATKCSTTLALLAVEADGVDGPLASERERLDRLSAAGERVPAAISLATVATLLAMRGDLDTARAHLAAARRVFGEAGLVDQVVWCDQTEALQLMKAGRGEDAVPLLTEVLELDQAPSTQAAARRMLAVAYWSADRRDDAIAQFEAALAIHARLGPPQEAAICASGIGELEAESGRLDAAVERFAEAVDRYVALGPEFAPARAVAERDLAVALATNERPWEAVELLEQSKATLAAHEDPAGAAESGLALALALTRIGEPAAAAEEAAIAAATFERAGAVEPAAAAHHRAAEFLDRLDRDDEAITHYQAAQDGFTAAGNQLDAASARARKGTLLGVVGRGDEGLAEIDAAAAAFAAADELFALGRCHDQAGRVLAGLGRTDDAVRRCAAGIACFEQVGFGPGVAELHLLAGRVLASAGRLGEAVGRLTEALAAFERLRLTEGAMTCHGVLVDVLTDLGHHDEAAAHERAMDDLA